MTVDEMISQLHRIRLVSERGDVPVMVKHDGLWKIVHNVEVREYEKLDTGLIERVVVE